MGLELNCEKVIIVILSVKVLWVIISVKSLLPSLCGGGKTLACTKLVGLTLRAVGDLTEAPNRAAHLLGD